MFDHPFYTTLCLSLLLSFCRVLFVDRSLFAFISQFIGLPYWAVLLIFIFFSVLRKLRESKAYRLLHIVYHESGRAVSNTPLIFTAQSDEFGLL